MYKCKFCGVGGLTWVQFGNKWSLEDSKGNRHRCVVTKKLSEKSPEKLTNFHNDPLIDKALREFKTKLRGEGKIYVIKNIKDSKWKKR